MREVIRPALSQGEIVLCDRFYDSSIAYQGYGRELDLLHVKSVIDFAVGPTRPDLTLLLYVPLCLCEARRQSREAVEAPVRDRIEGAGRKFFERVERGFQAIAKAEPQRLKWIDATGGREEVRAAVWAQVEPLLKGK